MKRGNVFFVLCSVMVTMAACSQTKSLVKQVSAFYVVRLPGILPTEEAGRPVTTLNDTTNIVYVETNQADISWQEAIIHRKSYTIIAERLGQTPVEVGSEKSSEKEIKLTPGTTNYLWRLTFQPKEATLPGAANEPILLKGKLGNQSFTIPVTTRKEIVFPDRIQ